MGTISLTVEIVAANSVDGALPCYICIMNKLQNTFMCLTCEAYVHIL